LADDVEDYQFAYLGNIISIYGARMGE